MVNLPVSQNIQNFISFTATDHAVVMVSVGSKLKYVGKEVILHDGKSD